MIDATTNTITATTATTLPPRQRSLGRVRNRRRRRPARLGGAASVDSAVASLRGPAPRPVLVAHAHTRARMHSQKGPKQEDDD